MGALGIGVSPIFGGVPPSILGGGGTGPTNPAVPTLTAPSNGANLSNGFAVTLSATSPDGDLTRIDWILDPAGAATVVATDTVAPYSQSWTPTGVSAGAHVLIARAVRGAFSTDSTSITINIDVAPAVPVLTAPANVYNGLAATLSATSTDTDLTRIDWILDPAGSATVVATDSVSPYSQGWTPSGVSIANHTLIARAVRGGQSTDSASFTVAVGTLLHSLVSSVTCLASWQSDLGLTMGATPLASGTTPPAVTLSGTPSGGLVALRLEIQTTGALGVGTFRYGVKNDGSTSATWIEQNVTLPAGGTYAAIGDMSGVTFTFPAGTYTNNNVYQGLAGAWVDQKNAISLGQATQTKQPRILVQAGSRLALRFDGVDDSLFSSLPDLPAPNVTPTYMYVGLRQNAWVINHVYFDSNGATEGCTLLTAASTPRIAMFCGSSVNQHTGAAIGSLVRAQALFSGSTSDSLKLGSGAPVTGASAGTSNPSAGVRFAAAMNDSSWGNCDIVWALYFNAAPSGAELSALDAAVSAMYGATI